MPPRSVTIKDLEDAVAAGSTRAIQEQKTERLRSLEAHAEGTEARTRKLEQQLREAEAKAKDRVIGRAVREGRLQGAAQVDEWSRKYDADPEFVKRVFDDLHPRAHEIVVGRTFTRADFGETIDPLQEEQREAAARLGVAVEDMI